ncbi:hypothetical protein ACFOYU_12055 [Microvirga sp. GCM10011540]|uniref:hypothetical protein n=1 Tax=Microvirga sp. GCM10011540 TaxID=3317338 RepID=UPI00361DE562
MHKTLRMMAASTVALGVMIGGAEAKKVYYDINGQRFSYESSDPEQVASARKRIDAANAADAAKARADAERLNNPLVGVFGSTTQQAALQAQENLKRVLAEQAAADATRQRQRAAQAAREEQLRKEAEQQQQQAAEAPEAQPDVQEEPRTAAVEPAAPAPAAPPVPTAETAAAPEAAPDPSTTQTIKSVSFDVSSGIKTVVMTDGTIHEEPFDSSTLARLDSDPADDDSLSAFVKRLRKAVSVETTGSTAVQVAQPKYGPR